MGQRVAKNNDNRATKSALVLIVHQEMNADDLPERSSPHHWFIPWVGSKAGGIIGSIYPSESGLVGVDPGKLSKLPKLPKGISKAVVPFNSTFTLLVLAATSPTSPPKLSAICKQKAFYDGAVSFLPKL
jgi:hypothetical protein